MLAATQPIMPGIHNRTRGLQCCSNHTPAEAHFLLYVRETAAYVLSMWTVKPKNTVIMKTSSLPVITALLGLIPVQPNLVWTVLGRT